MSTVQVTSVEVAEDGGFFRVTPIFSGVDRPASITWSFQSGDIAYRLRSAMLAGKAFDGLSAEPDVKGRTFANYAAQNFATVTIEDDLEEMGF